MSDQDRLDRLIAKWQAHVAEKHPAVHMDDARYDRNLACTYIECCIKDCTWKHTS